MKIDIQPLSLEIKKILRNENLDSEISQNIRIFLLTRTKVKARSIINAIEDEGITQDDTDEILEVIDDVTSTILTKFEHKFKRELDIGNLELDDIDDLMQDFSAEMSGWLADTLIPMLPEAIDR